MIGIVKWGGVPILAICLISVVILLALANSMLERKSKPLISEKPHEDEKSISSKQDSLEIKADALVAQQSSAEKLDSYVKNSPKKAQSKTTSASAKTKNNSSGRTANVSKPVSKAKAVGTKNSTAKKPATKKLSQTPSSVRDTSKAQTKTTVAASKQTSSKNAETAEKVAKVNASSAPKAKTASKAITSAPKKASPKN